MMSFVSKNKSESWTSNPQSDSEERIRIYNIVRQKSEPTRCANHSVDDIASACSLFFSRFNASRNWHVYDYRRKLETQR